VNIQKKTYFGFVFTRNQSVIIFVKTALLMGSGFYFLYQSNYW